MTEGFGGAAKDFQKKAWKECLRKRRYGAREGARLAAKRAEQRGHTVHPYRCDFCGGWHIGHYRG